MRGGWRGREMKSVSILLIPFLAGFLFMPQRLTAQTDQEKAAVVAAVGDQAGNALLSTHDAVNKLPTIREGGVFPESEVKELATSYRETSELCLRLVNSSPPSVEQKRIVDGAVLLIEQAKAMEKIIHGGIMDIPGDYTALQEMTTATIFGRAIAETVAPAAPGTAGEAAEVRAIADKLRGGMQLAREYEPTAEQIQKIAATPGAAKKITDWAVAVYESIPANASTAKEGQTETIVRGPSLDELPGGYGDVRDQFAEGVSIYGFKYVTPGATVGMAYDGLFKVDGEWIFIPKAWRALAAP